MQETLKIIGGNKLRGNITPVPNKNSIVAAIPASLLTDEDVIYKNIPETTDVKILFEILRGIGAQVDDKNYKKVTINCSKVDKFAIDQEMGNRLRASILFAGPLLARFGKAKIPVPGGCVLGKRSISSHIDAFTKVGIKIKYQNDGFVYFERPKRIKKEYFVWLSEASVTATENLVFYSAGVDSKITIIDAACEPHVSQNVELMENMGATVTGRNSNKLVIEGKENLNGAVYTPQPDHVDIGGIIVAAAITKSRLTIKNSNIFHIVEGLINYFEKFNIKFEFSGDDLIVDGRGELIIDPKTSGFPLAGSALPKFLPRPWPGFPVDILPVVVTLACKTKGSLLVQNWMYESGLDFVTRLNTLGADIFVSGPQRVIVKGPVKFSGGTVTAPSIIQATKAIFLAGLADNVETTIIGADILKRRYPDVVKVYKKLGADIKVVK